MIEPANDKPASMPAGEKLYFDKVTEHRGAYFVEYYPPHVDGTIATLYLIFVDVPDDAAIAAAMEDELALWLKRYPVPLMVTGWDAKENILRTKSDHLVGWVLPGTTQVVHSWQIDNLSAFLKSHPSTPDWRAIYRDIPFKTDAEVKANADRFIEERRQLNRRLKIFLFGWIACLVGFALFQYFGPEWLGLLALLFALSKAGRTAYRLWRNSKPSPSEEKEAEKQRKMRLYYDHCERNPQGFARLQAENFEKETEERTRQEAEVLAKRATAV